MELQHLAQTFERGAIILGRRLSHVFRASAPAWVSAQYSVRSDDFQLKVAANVAADAAETTENAAAKPTAYAAAYAVYAAAYAAALAAAAPDVYENAARAADFARAAAAHAFTAADPAQFTVWDEVLADVQKAQQFGTSAITRSPLWSHGAPEWAQNAWVSLQVYLPKGEDWEVWIDWYEQRLRGGSRAKEYELVFANVPSKVWEKGPAAANAWIKEHLSGLGDEDRNSAEPEIDDEESLRTLLGERTREEVIAVAARVALRVVPVAVREIRERPNFRAAPGFASLISGIFRATGVAWVASKYASRENELVTSANRAGDAARGVADNSDLGSAGRVVSTMAAVAADAVSDSARTGIAFANGEPMVANSIFGAVIGNVAASVATAAAVFDYTALWQEVRADVVALQKFYAHEVADLPLWAQRPPEWAEQAWAILQEALPEGEDWDVWFDWYDERLRGGSRSEDYELVFASVPQEEWDKGPAAVNAWIKAHLPKAPEAARSVDLPEPLPDLDAPFAYGWNTKLRVEVVAGAQNLPFYSFFSSEEDHRHTLEACRVSAERLLKDLREGSYGNAVRWEYSKRLKYYLDDLPKTAGAGNILLANDQIVVLRAMLALDDAVPFPFAADLGRLVQKQAALNGFYDLVRRHEQAVAQGDWSQPFPFEAAKRFVDTVRENTPGLFEPEVGEGLHRVEEAAPSAVAEYERPIPPEAQRAPIQFPELPASAPDPEHSRQRQIATAANALWTVFLKGKDLPAAIEGWTQVAHKLGENIGPILHFLRGLGGG